MGIIEEIEKQDKQRYIEKHEQHKQDMKQKFDKIQHNDEQLEYADELETGLVCAIYKKNNRKISICHGKDGEKHYDMAFQFDDNYQYHVVDGYRNVIKIKDWFLDKKFTTYSELKQLEAEEKQKLVKKKEATKPSEKESKNVEFKYQGVSQNW